MAETQPQPPAPASSTSREDPPLGPIRENSPAPSDGTDCTVIPLERSRAMEPELFSRTAVFSTELGRRPARDPPGPPFAPVIVRSDRIKGVVYYANYWRNKHPRIYHSFFPDSGWTIGDLWDKADIHLESPGFLEEVLGFICRDNAYRVHTYVYEWSKAHPEKLETVGGDMSQLYDAPNPAAIVDKIFTQGETEQYPHIFLWHVFRNMRTIMSNTMKNQQTVTVTGDDRVAVKANSEAINTLMSEPSSTASKPATIAHMEQPQSASSSVGAHPPQQADMPYLPPSVTTPTMYAPGPSDPRPRGLSAASQPGRVYSNQANGHQLGQHATTAPPPYANGQLRNPRSRAPRAASNPYGMPPEAQGWGDNIPVLLEHQMRQSSGQMAPGQSPHLVPPLPVGPGMMPPYPMMQYPPSGPSPRMLPVRARYGPTQQTMVPPHAAQFVPHPIDPAFPQFGPSGPEHHGVPFNNMTNNSQYPPRGTDPRGPLPRRSSYASKPPRLFDPYGSERPDKAGFTRIPAKTNVGKTRQGSVSNSNGRPGKYYGNFESQSFERDGSMKHNGYYGDPTYTQAPYHQFKHETADGLDDSCDKHYIGADNTTIFDLYVTRMPHDVTAEELGSFFQHYCRLTPTKVIMKFSPSGDQLTHAFVNFSSTAEARRGLQADSRSLRGNSLHVSVPRRHWDVQMFSHGQMANSHGHIGNRVTSYRTNSPSNDEAVPKLAVQYSPQDARSDLRGGSHQQQEYPTALGSPEARKRNAYTLSKGNDLPTKEEQPVRESARVADPLNELGNEQQPTQTESVDAQQPIPTALPSVEPFEDSQAGAVDLVPTANPEEDINPDQAIVSSDPKVITGESKKEGVKTESLRSSSEGASSSGGTTIIHLTPSNHPSPPTYLTAKVALPPVPCSPAKPSKEVPVSQEASANVEHVEEDRPQDTAITVRTQDDMPSDDDQKNDLSFHSAKESQSDVAGIEHKGKSDVVVDVTQGPTVSTTGDMTPTLPQHAESKPAGEKFELTETTTDATQQQELKESVTVVDKPSSEAAKKSGAKQTQSLFPFAKPKNQTKKEKQAKKKDKKKDKDKGKTEKVTPPTNAKDTAVVAMQLDTTKHAQKPDAQSERGSAAESTAKPEIPSRDGMEGAKDTTSTSVEATAGAVLDGRNRGKHETQKLDIQQPTVAQKAMQTQPGANLLETCAPSHSELPSAASLPQSGPVAVEQQQAQDKDQPVKKTKQPPPMIAVPKLGDLLKTRPSAASKASAPDLTSPASQPSKDAWVTNETGGDSLSSAQVAADQVSIGSSPTLRAESPPPISSSPTNSTFFTPMQTPSDFNARSRALSPPHSATGPPPGEPTKKKKKNKKKKTSLSAVNTADEMMTTNHEVKEPFADQLNEIEGIKTATTSGNYYLRSAHEPAGKECRSEDKDSRNLFRTVHNYVKEKVDSYARLPEKSWGPSAKQQSEFVTPEVYDEIVHKDDSTIVKKLIQDEDLPEEDPRKVKKAGTKPLFHE